MRANRTLEQMLRVLVAPAQDDWVELPPAIEFVSSSAVHDTEQTPYVLNFGRQLPTPMDRAVGDVVLAAYDFVGAVLRAMDDAEHNMEKAQLRQKSYADCRRHDEEFQAGEEVPLRMAPGACKLRAD